MYAYLFRKHPFIRILIALILGIALESVFLPGHDLLWIFSGSLIFLVIILRLIVYRTIWRRPLEGIALLMLVVLLGSGLAALQRNSVDKAFRELNPGAYVLQIEDIPYLKNDKLRVRAVLFGSDTLGEEFQSQLQISIDADSLSRLLKPGDLIYASLKPMRVSSDGIPEGFDYAAYLRKQEIWFQAIIKKDDWISVSSDSVKLQPSFLRDVALIRYSLIRKMHSGGLDPPVQAFIAALVLGYKKDLDPQLKEQFTSIGVVHVLAVSGLHIGIIYWVLQKLFFFLLMIKGGRYINVFVVLGFLWFYVFLAGFSPSVLRAAFMFSLVQAARIINRNSSVFNVLAASAFILLIHSPSALYDLGFLFSYLAVAGILLVQPVLLQLIEFKSSVLKYLYTMMALSLSAQLLVTPLSIYYFHQFPLVFILANLVMVPVVVAFIYPASLYLLLPAGSWPAKMLEFVLDFGYRLIAWLSGFFESFPMAKLENIRFDSIQLVLWYVFLLFFIIYLSLRIPRSALVLLIVLMAVIVNDYYGKYKAERQTELLVFYQQSDWWIVLIDGRKASTLSRQLSDSIVRPKLRNYYLSRRVEVTEHYCLEDSASGMKEQFERVGEYLFWRNQVLHLAYLEKGRRKRSLFEEIDFTIGGYALDSLPDHIQQITRYPSSKGIPVHAASSQGAFFKEL